MLPRRRSSGSHAPHTLLQTLILSLTLSWRGLWLVSGQDMTALGGGDGLGAAAGAAAAAAAGTAATLAANGATAGSDQVAIPDVWIVGIPDPATATLARLLSHHEQLDVRLGSSVDCQAAPAGPSSGWGAQLWAATRASREQGKLVVAGCAQLWALGSNRILALLNEALLASRRGMEMPAVKAVFVVADEPAHLYDAWNAFCWPGLDEGCTPNFPSRGPEHMRTPERFHELVMSQGQEGAAVGFGGGISGSSSVGGLFPPLNASQRWQYGAYRSALGERLLAVSAHQLYDRPWETLYRVESFLGLRHHLWPPPLLDDVSAQAGGVFGGGAGGRSAELPPLPPAEARLQADALLRRPGDWEAAAHAAVGRQQQQQQAGGGGAAGAGAGGAGLGLLVAGEPPPLPMLEATRQALEVRWADDCRALTEKAHVWLPSCPLIAADGPGGATRGARPVLQRRGKAFTAAKLIGLLRSKKRELVRGANSYVQQQLGMRDVTLGLRQHAQQHAGGGGGGGGGLGADQQQHADQQQPVDLQAQLQQQQQP